jgi:chromosome segregation ATPase
MGPKPSPQARIRQLEQENNRLKSESEEGARHVCELRKIVLEFDAQLEEARLEFANMSRLSVELERARDESARYSREVGILTRALAVHSVEAGVDGESALARASAEWDLDQVKHELDRLRGIEDMFSEVTRQNVEMKKVVTDLESRQVENLQIRLHHDTVSQANKQLLDKNDSLTRELTRVKDSISELETRLRISMSAKSEEESRNRILTSRVNDLSRELDESRTELKEMSKVKKKVSELSTHESELNSALETAKSTITQLESDIVRLNASLQAEVDAAATVTCRVEKLETELHRCRTDRDKFKNRIEELEICVSDHSAVAATNEVLRRELFELENECTDKDERIAQLVSARDIQKQCMSAEIQRLSEQLEVTLQRSHEMTTKYAKISKEKDRIKSLLAKDTMSRLSRVLDDSNASRWSVNSFPYN